MVSTADRNQKVAAALLPVDIMLFVWAESMLFLNSLSREYWQ